MDWNDFEHLHFAEFLGTHESALVAVWLAAYSKPQNTTSRPDPSLGKTPFNPTQPTANARAMGEREVSTTLSRGDG